MHNNRLWFKEPAIYEHKAALIGKTPAEVANSAELLTEAVLKEYEVYQADYITVGLDVYNIEAEALGAKLSVSAENECPDLAGTLYALNNLPERLTLPDLADGDYEAVFKLDSGPSQTVGFQRKRYSFERNTLGMSNEAVPPYLPVVVNPDKPMIHGGGASPKTAIEKPKGDLVLVWGRGYEFGANGLPARIQAAPPTGASGGIEDVLAAPIRIEATVGGKTLAVEGTGSRITEALPHKAVVASEGKAGKLGGSLSSTVEYDGWIEVALTLKLEGEIALDALDLLVDVRNFEGDAKRLPSPADTLYVQRKGGGVDNSYHGEIQTKPGVTFESAQIGAMTARGGRYLTCCIVFSTYGAAGKTLAATPDGRRSGAVLNDSAAPTAGRDISGPTALIKSTTTLPLADMLGTPVVNVRLSKNMLSSPDGMGKALSLLKSYYRLGGMQWQVSVASADEMRAAKKKPENWRNLIVRIGGFSIYFNSLSPEMQDSVIARTEICS